MTHHYDSSTYPPNQLLDSKAAARWVDKEIRKLIDAIVEYGDKSGKAKVTIKYKTLFDSTDQIFEALSGTLKTAKKRKVVKYKGEVLFQGANDDVVCLLRGGGGGGVCFFWCVYFL